MDPGQSVMSSTGVTIGGVFVPLPSDLLDVPRTQLSGPAALEVVDEHSLPLVLRRGDKLVYRSDTPCDLHEIARQEEAEIAAGQYGVGSRRGNGDGSGGGRGGFADADGGRYAMDEFSYVSVDKGGLTSGLSTGIVELYCVARASEVSEVWNILFRLLSMCGMVLCAALGVFFFRHRAEPIVKASSLVFNLLALTGCAGLYCTVPILLNSSSQPLTRPWCFARWALPYLSFMLLFSSLFAKTLRVWRIFSNTALVDVGRALSTFDLLKVVVSLVSLAAGVLLVYGLVHPPEPMLVYMMDDAHTVYQGCTVSAPWHGLLLGSGFALLVALAVLTFRVRHVPSLFNEQGAIGVSIYNSTAVSSVGVALDFALRGNYTAQSILRCMLLLIGMSVIVAALWGTKVAQLWHVWAQMQDGTSTGVSTMRRRLRRKLVREAIKAGKTQDEAEADASAEMERRDRESQRKARMQGGGSAGYTGSSGTGSGGNFPGTSGVGLAAMHVGNISGTGGPAKGRLSRPSSGLNSSPLHGSGMPSLHAGEKQAQLAQLQLQEKVQAHLRKQQQQQLAAASPNGTLERARAASSTNNSSASDATGGAGGGGGFTIPVLQLSTGRSAQRASSGGTVSGSGGVLPGTGPYVRSSAAARRNMQQQQQQLTSGVGMHALNVASSAMAELAHQADRLRMSPLTGALLTGRAPSAVPSLPELSLAELVSLSPAALLQWQANLAMIVASASRGRSSFGAGGGAGAAGANSAVAIAFRRKLLESSTKDAADVGTASNGGVAAGGAADGTTDPAADSATGASTPTQGEARGDGTPPSKGSSGSSGGYGGRSSSSSPMLGLACAASPRLDGMQCAPMGDGGDGVSLANIGLHVLPEVSVEATPSPVSLLPPIPSHERSPLISGGTSAFPVPFLPSSSHPLASGVSAASFFVPLSLLSGGSSSARRRVSASPTPALPDLVPEEERTGADEEAEADLPQTQTQTPRTAAVPALSTAAVTPQQMAEQRAALEAALQADSFSLATIPKRAAARRTTAAITSSSGGSTLPPLFPSSLTSVPALSSSTVTAVAAAKAGAAVPLSSPSVPVLLHLPPSKEEQPPAV